MKTRNAPLSLKPTVMCLTALFLFLTTVGFADAFDTTQLVAETNKIRSFLFGPAAKAIAIFSGAWGIIQAFLSGSSKPLYIYGAICLAACFLPKFIDMVF